MLYFVGLFGIFALLIGTIILIRPTFGEQFFGDWNTLKLNIARLAVSSILIGVSWRTRPNLIFVAGCVVTAATIFLALIGRWERGRNFVQYYLVESRRGMRIYVLCAIIPVGALLVAGAIVSLTGN